MLNSDGLFFANNKARATVSLSSDPNGMSGLKFDGTNGKVSWSAPRSVAPVRTRLGLGTYPAIILTPAAAAARRRSASVVAKGKLRRMASAKYAAS